jgi:hypothetical protein
MAMTNAEPEIDINEMIDEYFARRAEAKEQGEEPKAKAQPKPPPDEPDEPTNKALEAMNKEHAIIDNVAGKAVIASWEPSELDTSKKTVVYHSKTDFLLRYSNRHMSLEVPDNKGGTKTQSLPLGQWWLAHRGRRQYRGVTFEPGRPPIINGCLNLWEDWGLVAKQGDWGLIWQHIDQVIASGNPVFAEYVKRWIAWAIQNPDKQAEVALVLIGEKGAGKGTLARCLQRIFGAHAFQVTTPDEVVGRFNAHLHNCVLLIADEAYWVGGDKQKACVGRLQAMITEPYLSIEPKGIGIFKVRNLLHILMLAEPGWVIPAGRHERRCA